MHDLRHYMATELPRINALLDHEADKLDPVVTPVVRHMLTAGGKRLRPMLTLLTSRSLGRTGDDLYPMACALEFLHSATLLHDDILDGADLRRGYPAAHLLFGVTQTILAGDALLALGNKLIADYGVPRLTACISEAIIRTASGEIADIAHIRDTDLTQEQYLEIVTGKTACLIQAACHCGAILAGAEPRVEEAASSFGLNLGIAFQLVDDALDYASSRHVAGKPVGADLREGKLTMPLIFYVRELDESGRNAFALRLKRNDFSDEALNLLVEEVRRRGCDQRTRDLAGTYLTAAAEALELFPVGHERSLLEQALRYVLTRDK